VELNAAVAKVIAVERQKATNAGAGRSGGGKGGGGKKKGKKGRKGR